MKLDNFGLKIVSRRRADVQRLLCFIDGDFRIQINCYNWGAKIIPTDKSKKQTAYIIEHEDFINLSERQKLEQVSARSGRLLGAAPYLEADIKFLYEDDLDFDSKLKIDRAIAEYEKPTPTDEL